MQAHVIRGRWACPSLGVLVGMVVGLGCWVRADHHCSNLEGDATCAERGGGSFCDVCRAAGDGCTDELPSVECHFAGIEPGGETIGTTATEATMTESSGQAPTSGALQCTSDADCGDGAAPFCTSEGLCVACDGMPDADAACAGLDAAMPVCVDGECVQCSEGRVAACDATLRICDAEAHACIDCTEHEPCASGACELRLGRCFPPDVTAFEVDGDGSAEYPNVGAAVAAIGDGGMGIIRVHARDGGASYPGALRIDGGKTIAVLAAEGEEPAFTGALGGHALRVEGSGTTVYLDRVWLRDTADGRGLVVRQGATAWVDRSRLVRNSDGGVLAEEGASLTIRSSFVGGNASDVAAVEVIGADARILYTTVGGGQGNARALLCNAAAAVDVRNSVLLARTDNPEIACDATFEHDAAELDLGGTNVAVGSMSTSWFTSYPQADFSLSAEGADVLADIARWQQGDPRVDIDGDPRPSGADGVSDHAGADVP